MKCAVCQMEIEPYQKQNNYKKAEKYIKVAREHNAHLILFPEMSFTGFLMDTELTGEWNEETLTYMRNTAKKHEIAIGFGWVKNRRNKKAQNHYTIVSKGGEILGDYIKVHPFSFGREDEYFQGGMELVSFPLEDIHVGIQICYDLRFPEAFQSLSRNCDVIVVPANWPGKRGADWKCLLQARAIENQCYIVGVNCVGEWEGQQYWGDSVCYLPDGALSCRARSEETLFFVEIKQDVEQYRSRFTTKKDRKNSLYIQWYREMETREESLKRNC